MKTANDGYDGDATTNHSERVKNADKHSWTVNAKAGNHGGTNKYTQKQPPVCN